MDIVLCFRILLGLSLLVTSHGAQPNFLGAYKMTFASAEPVKAQEFAIKYLGAKAMRQPHKGGDGECALIKWVGFPGSNPGAPRGMYQFHFVKAYHYPNGSMTLDVFEQRMAALHGGFEHFDQFMDFHVTLGTEDLDPLAAALVADDVPMLLRRQASGNFSLFVEVPHGIVIEVVSPKLTVLEPQAWSRCGSPRRPVSVNRVALQAGLQHRDTQAPPIYRPLRAVYASTDPASAAQYLAKYFDGELITNPSESAKQYFGDGFETCYQAAGVQWASSINGLTYEVWWVHSPEVRDGPTGLHLEDYESYLLALHGNITTYNETYDEYMDNHMALFVQDADPIITTLQDNSKRFFLVGQYGDYYDIFIEGPRGQIYEISAWNLTIIKDYPIWDLCKNRTRPHNFLRPTTEFQEFETALV